MTKNKIRERILKAVDEFPGLRAVDALRKFTDKYDLDPLPFYRAQRLVKDLEREGAIRFTGPARPGGGWYIRNSCADYTFAHDADGKGINRIPRFDHQGASRAHNLDVERNNQRLEQKLNERVAMMRCRNIEKREREAMG